MNSSNPGNQLIMNFNVAGSMDYILSGQIEGAPGEVGAGHLIALQKFDGLVWQNHWMSWSLPGLQGSFNTNGTLTPGQYRLFSQIGLKADAGESWSTSYNYNFAAVPEPITAFGLLPALWFMRRRRR